MKMILLIWILSILAYLVADVRMGASQAKEPLHCYACVGDENTTDCYAHYDQSQMNCTPDLPYCGTTAKSPDYISSLACTEESQTPCALQQTAQDSYEITCTCDSHLCNKPFTREFRNELLNFSPTHSPENTTGGLLQMFMNSSVFSNITTDKFYEAVTLSMRGETSKLTPVSSTSITTTTIMSSTINNANIPRAEALKHEVTVPSDDDEDGGEGSGSFEEVKPQAPAAPAAPSSFLPANENIASLMHVNLLATIPFISLYAVA